MSNHQHIIERYTVVLAEGFLTEMAHIVTPNKHVVDIRWEQAPHEDKASGAVGNWFTAFNRDNLYMDLGPRKFRFGVNARVQRVAEIPADAVVFPPNFVDYPLVMSPQDEIMYIGQKGIKNHYENEVYDALKGKQDLVDALLKASA